MDATEINLDLLWPDELAAVESDLKEQLRLYLRHIVGLAIAYEHIGADGSQKPQKPLHYSAAVCQIDHNWFLLTAGHILRDVESIIRHPQMRLVACGLDDTYAPGSNDKTPIQYFDLENAPRFHRYRDDGIIAESTEGLDFGLVHLRKNYQDLLQANGIQPLTEQHWNDTHVQECTTFLMVGFPDDSVDSDIVVSRTHYSARVKGSPSVIFIDRLESHPVVGQSEYPRFFGQIRPEHDVGSIVGMSGGPIFGFKDYDFEPYYVAGIQSKWIEERKLTFGCPLPVVLEVAPGPAHTKCLFR